MPSTGKYTQLSTHVHKKPGSSFHACHCTVQRSPSLHPGRFCKTLTLILLEDKSRHMDVAANACSAGICCLTCCIDAAQAGNRNGERSVPRMENDFAPTQNYGAACAHPHSARVCSLTCWTDVAQAGDSEGEQSVPRTETFSIPLRIMEPPMHILILLGSAALPAGQMLPR